MPTGSQLEHEDNTWPSLIAFYVGRQDSRFLNMNKQFDAALRRSGVRHVFKIYPGGHSGTLWQGEAPSWLGMALDSLKAESHRH